MSATRDSAPVGSVKEDGQGFYIHAALDMAQSNAQAEVLMNAIREAVRKDHSPLGINSYS